MKTLVIISSTEETFTSAPDGFNSNLVHCLQGIKTETDVYFIGEIGQVPSVAPYQNIVISGSDWRISEGDMSCDILYRFKTILNAARSNSVPVLGICFGAQIIAYLGGGTIRASGHGGHTSNGNVSILVSDSAFVGIGKDTIDLSGDVIAMHYDNIVRVGAHVSVSGKVHDTCGNSHIAVFESEGVVGVQFHLSMTRIGIALLSKFVLGI